MCQMRPLLFWSIFGLVCGAATQLRISAFAGGHTTGPIGSDPTLTNRKRAFVKGFYRSSGAEAISDGVAAVRRSLQNGVGSEGRAKSTLQAKAEQGHQRTLALARARAESLHTAMSQSGLGNVDAAARGLYHAEKAHQVLGHAVEDSMTTLSHLPEKDLVKASQQMTQANQASHRYADLVAAAARVGGASDQHVGKPSVYRQWHLKGGAADEEARMSLAHGAGRATGAAAKAVIGSGVAAGLGVVTGGIGTAAAIGVGVNAGAGLVSVGNEVKAGISTARVHKDQKLSAAEKSQAVDTAEKSRDQVNRAVELLSAPVLVGSGGAGAVESLGALLSMGGVAGSAAGVAAHGISAGLDVHGTVGSARTSLNSVRDALVSLSPGGSGRSTPVSSKSVLSRASSPTEQSPVGLELFPPTPTADPQLDEDAQASLRGVVHPKANGDPHAFHRRLQQNLPVTE